MARARTVLPTPGDVFDQYVAAGQQGDDPLVDGIPFAVEDLFDIAAQLLQALPTFLALKRFGWLDGHAGRSVSSR